MDEICYALRKQCGHDSFTVEGCLECAAADMIERLARQVPEMQARANHYEAENGRQAEMLNSVIQQRDELLAALVECLECEFAVTDKAAISRARAAIANVKP